MVLNNPAILNAKTPVKKQIILQQFKNIFLDYLTLCKPKVISLMLVTSWVGMFLAAHTFITFKTFSLTTLGISFSGGCAAILNHLIDLEIDKQMSRTAKRPIATGRISKTKALLFALILGCLGLFILYYFINILTAQLTFLTIIGYAVIYSIFLKHSTPQNIVIGGIAGAMPPLLGWTAITNEVNAFPLILVMIIYIWTPPHFWSLAIYRFEDYQKAHVPMLPITHGIKLTQLFILLYTILLLIISLVPYLIGMTGEFYLIIASISSIIFLYQSIKLYRIHAIGNNVSLKQQALYNFKFSIIYLIAIFISLMIDHLLL